MELEDVRHTLPTAPTPNGSSDTYKLQGREVCSVDLSRSTGTESAPSLADENVAPSSEQLTATTTTEQDTPLYLTKVKTKDSASAVNNETDTPTLNCSKVLSEIAGCEKVLLPPDRSSVQSARFRPRLSLNLDMPPPMSPPDVHEGSDAEDSTQGKLSGGGEIAQSPEIDRQFQVPGPYPDNDCHCTNSVPGAYFVEGSYGNQTEGFTLDREHGEGEGSGAEPLTASLAASAIRSYQRRVDSSLMLSDLSEAAEERLRGMARDAPLVEGIVVERRGKRAGMSLSKRLFDWVRRHHYVDLAILFMCFFAIAVAIVVFMAIEATSISPVRFQKLLHVISAVSANDTLSNQASPQFKALSWMANKDLTILAENEEAIIQRYVMALLYFSTDGENWAGNDLSHNAEMECTFINYVCWDTFEGIQMERSGGKSYLSLTWHECDWEGVGCYEGTDIVGAISLGE